MTTISQKNRVTIPPDVLHSAGLRPGDELRVHRVGPGRIELVATRDLVDEHAGALDGTVYPPGYLDDVRGRPR
jgi:AbrB family looped-hinge helix DNA binding protein